MCVHSEHARTRTCCVSRTQDDIYSPRASYSRAVAVAAMKKRWRTTCVTVDVISGEDKTRERGARLPAEEGTTPI